MGLEEVDLKECPMCDRMQPDVEVRDDPYLFELYGEEEEYHSCYECWSSRKADV